MPKKKIQQPPIHRSPRPRPAEPELHLLDRFSEQNLETWAKRSKDLDELVQRLYFDTEPARIALKTEICEALNKEPVLPKSFDDWVRVVGYRWSTSPLSSEGSIKTYGGRFNVGQDVDHAMRGPFPALYLAQDYSTAYREYFQKDAVGTDGLTAEELALTGSVAAVRLRGHLERVLDVTNPRVLENACAVLARIRMPRSVAEILRRLRVAKDKGPRMVRTPADLQQIFTGNWREWPVVYGIPSASQVFGQLAIDAGFEAVLYNSTKVPSKECLAVFPCNLGSDRTFVELVDDPPSGVRHVRLDITSADELSGLKHLPIHRPGGGA